MAQLALNVKVSNITKVTSFYVNYERKFNLFEKLKNQISIEFALAKVNKIKEIRNNIFEMQKKSTTYQNKKRKMAPLLKKRNKVYLYAKNLKINKGRSKKLDHVKVEPFFIKAIKGSINYELKLLMNVKKYFVFHVFVLKLTHSNTSIQTIFRYQLKEKQEHEVEQILQRQNQHYFIKWKEYLTSKNTWESLKNLENCQKLLQRFQRQKNQINLLTFEKKARKKIRQ